jgi:hypothetical protein
MKKLAFSKNIVHHFTHLLEHVRHPRMVVSIVVVRFCIQKLREKAFELFELYMPKV